MSRTAILVVVLILVLGGTALLFWPSPSVEEQHMQAERLVLTGHREDGHPAWSIEAQSGSLTGNEALLEDVELTFYEDSLASIIVHGERLSRDSGGSTLSGSTVVEQANTLTLKTETIFWDERNGVLEAGSVSIEMTSASINAGAFQHDLRNSVTTLTRGVEAELAREGTGYSIHSDGAETTADQLILRGDVQIHTTAGDAFRCQQLESETSGSSIRLVGDVAGTWQESAFAADSAQLDSNGIRLHGHVIIDLELLMMEPSDDA